ncbi:MAG TPA: hypothetical protein VGC95_03665, partial [Chitinophagaceae bacterium]
MSSLPDVYDHLSIDDVNLDSLQVSMNGEFMASGGLNVDHVELGRSKEPRFGGIDMHLDSVSLAHDGFYLRCGAIMASSKKSMISIRNLSVDDPHGRRAFLPMLRVVDVNIQRSLSERKLVAGSLLARGFTVQDRMYLSTIGEVEADARANRVVLHSIRITPRFSKYEFSRRLGHQADRVNAQLAKITIDKADLSAVFNKKMKAGKILIEGGKVDIFRDRRLPPSHHEIPLPVAYLESLPIEIQVSSLRFSATNVSYEEYPRSGYGATGTLEIKDFQGSAEPFVNRQELARSGFMFMKVAGSIMGSGTATCEVMMPFARNGSYIVRGSIRQLDLPKLNASSENLGKIHIKSGVLDLLDFDFRMSNTVSTGSIVGAYHQLIIQPFKKHRDKKNVANMASFMLRHFIIPL